MKEFIDYQDTLIAGRLASFGYVLINRFTEAPHRPLNNGTSIGS